jgi:hypothetical protein
MKYVVYIHTLLCRHLIIDSGTKLQMRRRETTRTAMYVSATKSTTLASSIRERRSILPTTLLVLILETVKMWKHYLTRPCVLVCAMRIRTAGVPVVTPLMQ